jgi:hypothetical protein
MSQSYSYPNSAEVTVAAVGTNGAVAPTSSIQVGAEDPSGDLQPLQVNASGEVLVSVDDLPLPAGAATEAKQDDQIAEAQTANSHLADISSDTAAISGQLPASLGQAPMADSLAVAIASDQSTLPVSAASLPLPSGAATLAEQQAQTALLTTIDADTGAIATSTASIDTKTPALVSGRVPVDVQTSVLPTGAATSANQATEIASLAVIEGAIGAEGAAPPAGVALMGGTDSGGTQVHTVQVDNQGHLKVDVQTSALPTGAATLAEQQSQTALLTTIDTDTGAIATSVSSIDSKTPALGQAAMAASVPVVIASNQSAIPVSLSGSASGSSRANAPTINDYASTPVTSSAYVQLIASTTSTANMIEIFDSSGVALYLAVGAAASEVDQFIITPGGNGQVPLAIPSGSRVSVKAASTSATVGFIAVNLYT